MCGNGLCCASKYVHDHYHKGKKQLKILTGAGIKVTKIQTGRSGEANKIVIDLGNPIFEGLKIPTTFNKAKVLNKKIKIGKQELTFSVISIGNPHCVVFVDDIKNFAVAELGSQIEVHKFFPQRVNVEFVQILNRRELIQRTWERGAGETLACGTGGAAVTVLSHLLGHTDAKIKIHFQGGDLQYEYHKDESVVMIGEAVEVFRGELNY
jgi:diaminopimelate epimerase